MEIKCFLERGFRVVIQNNESGINRQVYDLSSQIPGLDGWQRAHNSFSTCACHPCIDWVYLVYEETIFKLYLISGEFKKVYDTGDVLNEVKSIAVSKCGTYVNVIMKYGVSVINSLSDQIVFRMGTNGGVAPISPDEKLIALAGEQSIHVFELPSGELLYKKKRIQIRQCCFDDSGEYIIYSTDTNEVFLWKFRLSETTPIKSGSHIKNLFINGVLLDEDLSC